MFCLMCFFLMGTHTLLIYYIIYIIRIIWSYWRDIVKEELIWLRNMRRCVCMYTTNTFIIWLVGSYKCRWIKNVLFIILYIVYNLAQHKWIECLATPLTIYFHNILVSVTLSIYIVPVCPSDCLFVYISLHRLWIV